MKQVLVIFLVTFVHLAISDPGKKLPFYYQITGNKFADYYWRDYNGKIPDDAVEGGKDVTGKPTYIGQAFVLHHGILIGQIYRGKSSITTSKEGIHVTEVYNRILCSGHKENFRWIPGNSATLHLTTINKHLVAGGTEWDKILNIGRVQYQGELIVGKVCSGTIGKAKLYFPYRGEEVDVDHYEILVYEEGERSVIPDTN